MRKVTLINLKYTKYISPGTFFYKIVHINFTILCKTLLEANDMKVLRKIVGKTKIDRIRSQPSR